MQMLGDSCCSCLTVWGRHSTANGISFFVWLSHTSRDQQQHACLRKNSNCAEQTVFSELFWELCQFLCVQNCFHSADLIGWRTKEENNTEPTVVPDFIQTWHSLHVSVIVKIENRFCLWNRQLGLHRPSAQLWLSEVNNEHMTRASSFQRPTEITLRRLSAFERWVLLTSSGTPELDSRIVFNFYATCMQGSTTKILLFFLAIPVGLTSRAGHTRKFSCRVLFLDFQSVHLAQRKLFGFILWCSRQISRKVRSHHKDMACR